jgi:putative ABC transport system permease protein
MKRISSILQSFLHDCRYSIRILRKNPGFVLTVVVTLGLGIGANATIFSVVNAVLLEPLPYKEPDRLIRLWETNPGGGLTEVAVSVPNFQDWQKQQTSFNQLAASENATFNLTGNGDPQRVAAAKITANLIPTLKIEPVLGRSFLPDEEKPGANRVVLLSHSLWQRQFGSDPALLNRTIQLNGESYTVVGVMPAGFKFPALREHWVPLVLDPAKEPWRADRTNRNLAVFGRLKPTITVAQANADLAVVAQRLQEQYPKSNTGWNIRLRTFYDWIVPAEVRRVMLALFVAVELLLLVACANVANLLLARSTTRQQEIAIRAAVGARPMHLIRQLLTESLLLASLGGVLGLLLTFWGTKLIASLNAQNIARLNETRIDGAVLGFSLFTMIVIGLIFGLAPARWALHLDLTHNLKAGGRAGASKLTQRLRSSLVVAEVTMASVLLVSAGLFVRSLIRLQALPLGFAPENMITMQVSLPGSKYGEREQRVNFFDQLLERLRNVPGVVDAAAAELPAGAGGNWQMEITVERGETAIDTTRSSAEAHAATPHYFRAMNIPVLQGQEFSDSYRSDQPLELIVSESFARRYWPNENAIGKRFRPGTNNPFGTVVGVVGDVRTIDRQEEKLPAFYLPYGYVGMPSLVVAVRTTGQPETFATAVRTQVHDIDPEQPVYNIRTMTEFVASATAQQRLQASLSLIFSVVALLLVAVGIYGVVAYWVRQRIREIGVRMALGAVAADILKLVIAQGMRHVLFGLILGLAGAFALTRLLGSSVFGLSANDPLPFVVVTLLVAGVALAACYLPAWRATRVDPSIALRNE